MKHTSMVYYCNKKELLCNGIRSSKERSESRKARYRLWRLKNYGRNPYFGYRDGVVVEKKRRLLWAASFGEYYCVTTQRGRVVRIISVRRASDKERSAYDKNNFWRNLTACSMRVKMGVSATLTLDNGVMVEGSKTRRVNADFPNWMVVDLGSRGRSSCHQSPAVIKMLVDEGLRARREPRVG